MVVKLDSKPCSLVLGIFKKVLRFEQPHFQREVKREGKSF